MEEQKLGEKQLAILRILRLAKRPLTTHNIARTTHMNWHIASFLLEELFDQGYVERGKSEGGLTYWKLVEEG